MHSHQREHEPDAREVDVEARERDVEGADVGDADGGAGNGQDQRVEAVEQVAARRARASQDPGDGHAEHDAAEHGQP
jgi:hypothetical protein